jgi:hypothetical protein
MFSFQTLDSSNSQGTCFTKSYVSTVKYDTNGNPVVESYKSQSISQKETDGQIIKEKQEAYENTGVGLQKAAYEKLLNDKGHKVIKARNLNSGEEYEHNIFKGIRESKFY